MEPVPRRRAEGTPTSVARRTAMCTTGAAGTFTCRSPCSSLGVVHVDP